MLRLDSLLTVSQLNRYVKSILDGDFRLRDLYLRGEISNFTNHYRSGHFYFTLKDNSSSIRAIMFNGYASKVKFAPENGMNVVVSGNVQVFERDGTYQIYCETMEPDGIGALYLAFEQLKEKLSKEGLFAQEHKKPLPAMPMKIGVLTAKTGAALQDIINILSRRYPLATLVLVPTLVQGENAPKSIIHSLRLVQQRDDIDVLILGRGGGSIEDLWAFNDEEVAREIYHCTIPVISAVGHEIDYTIADFVADMRAPTPSAAAELAVFDYRQAMQELLGMRQQMDKELQRKVTVARNHLEHQRMRLHYLSPQQRMNENRRRVAEYEEKLTGRMEELLRERRHRLALLAGTLESYSPVKKLSGGYAFVEDGNHQALRSIHQIREKDTVQIHLLDGTLTAAVTEIQAAEGVKNE